MYGKSVSRLGIKGLHGDVGDSVRQNTVSWIWNPYLYSRS